MSSVKMIDASTATIILVLLLLLDDSSTATTTTEEEVEGGTGKPGYALAKDDQIRNSSA